MTTSNLRSNYARLIKKYQALGKGAVRLTESTLSLIQPINASKTSYLFPVLENEQQSGLPVLPEEIRLNINDEFIVSSIGIYLYGTQSQVDPALSGKRVFTYSPYEQNSSFITTADFYAGFLSVAVNKVNYIDKWDTRKHEYWGETQHKNFTIGAAAFQVDGGATIPSKDFSKDGIYTSQPNFTLSGAKKNEVIITLPNAISSAVGAFVTNANQANVITIDKMLIEFRGLLAQNGARFQN